MIFIYLIVQVYGAIITYDTNLFTGFDYKSDASFVCQSTTYTKSVTFSGTFANIPKVILTFDKLDLSLSNNYELSITSTTTTGLTLLINCPTPVRAYVIQIRWYAIDNPQSNQFIQQCQSNINQNIYPYQCQCIIWIYINHQYQIYRGSQFQAINFITYIIQQQHQLVIRIQHKLVIRLYWELMELLKIQVLKHLLQIIQVLQQIQNKIHGSQLYIMDLILLIMIILDYCLLLQLLKLKLATLQQIVQNQIHLGDQTYISNTHVPVLIPYKYIIIAEAFKIDNLHIRTVEDYQIDTHQNIEITFQQLSQTYSANGVYKLNVDSVTQTLNINLYLKCQTGKKMSSQFNYCGQCSDHKPYQQNRNCPETINVLKYFTRFKSTVSAVKELTITITSSSLLITQLAYTDSQAIQLNLISIQYLNV